MIVLKYGGTSVGTLSKMRRVARRIIEHKEKYGRVVVVVSAMGHTTDRLVALAHQAVKNPAKRELDMLLSTGEQVSTSLLAMMLHDFGHPAVSLNSFQAGIYTEGLYTKNKIKDIDTSRIERYLDEDNIVLITGFQGYNQSLGDVTTLGRGGSDTTAVAVAAKLSCPCHIYTDVTGIYTMDPRRHLTAKQLHKITYDELIELAFLGARVMEMRAVEIAKKYQVPLYIAAAHAKGIGTWVKEKSPMMEHNPLTGASVKDDILMITLHRLRDPEDSVAQLFEGLAQHEVNVDMISQTMIAPGLISLAFTCDGDDIQAVRAVTKELKAVYQDVQIEENDQLSKVSVVGIGMRSQPGVAATIFSLFSKHRIPFKLVTTSDISISYTVPKALATHALTVIAEQFGL